jgi:hypothetical protein
MKAVPSLLALVLLCSAATAQETIALAIEDLGCTEFLG